MEHFMLGFKSLWTTKSDWNLTWKSLVQTYHMLPRLVVFNSIFIVIILVLEIAYTYWISQKLVYAPAGIKNIMMYSVQLSFSVLGWTFLVFLVPYFLYNKTHIAKKAPLVLKIFIKDNIWPIVVESIKVFFVLIGYAIGGLLSVSLLAFCIISMITQNFWGVLGFLDNALLGLVTLAGDPSSTFKSVDAISMLIILFVALIPAMIKAIQYLLMPYVVFFHQKFTNNSLSLSAKSAHGIVIPMAVTLFTINLIYQPISYLVDFLKSIQLLHIGVDSLFRMLINIIYIAVLYFMYVQKDQAHIK